MDALFIQGRSVAPDQLEWIRHLIGEHPQWGRSRLSQHIAQQWNWRNAAGQLKDMAARTLLLKLERRALLQLPKRQRGGGSRSAPARHGIAASGSPGLGHLFRVFGGNASEIVAQSDILFRESIRLAATRPAMVVADFTVTCWPRMARRANSKPLNAPGTRNPGLALTDGPKTLSLARCSAMISQTIECVRRHGRELLHLQKSGRRPHVGRRRFGPDRRGSMGGFGGGLDRKRFLLGLENPGLHPDSARPGVGPG
jgi:hypothetical protein